MFLSSSRMYCQLTKSFRLTQSCKMGHRDFSEKLLKTMKKKAFLCKGLYHNILSSISAILSWLVIYVANFTNLFLLQGTRTGFLALQSLDWLMDIFTSDVDSGLWPFCLSEIHHKIHRGKFRLPHCCYIHCWGIQETFRYVYLLLLQLFFLLFTFFIFFSSSASYFPPPPVPLLFLFLPSY